ncbi:SPOR domain-containing protein [Curvibacter sp. HBC28]|uniref:SPOR domain-containing protein n=1 Tax=Curvibacter microcysteis TaxID=3026419 RepID=A0ABT5MEY0_9BURK|nr:SPOR domain-containing protein [Curvibacter sp. HBC28]MDD0813646.1 SPOR domain-containing protein [Curvibacter sp. HBC28]
MMKRQFGGTFLGLVIGVVLGLGAALAVAVYVTKVPVPFLNKGQTRSADQDAAEARKNKDWDPNSPLYGKNPVRPGAAGSVGGDNAPADASASSDKSADKSADRPNKASDKAEKADKADKASDKSSEKTADKSSDKPDVKPVTKGSDTKPVSADPLGDLARAKSGGSTSGSASSSSSGVDPFDYYVQVGAYRTNEDAEGQKAKLAMMGWEARVTEREQAGRTVFRVRVGPFGKRDDADRIKEKLEGAGLDTTLVRVQR